MQYSMAEDHSDWLNFAAACMSDVQWEVAAIRPDAMLSHRSCPWGGHLIRLDSKTLGYTWHMSWALRRTVHVLSGNTSHLLGPVGWIFSGS